METQTYDLPNKTIVITTTAVQTITQSDLQKDIDGATAQVAAAQANLTQTEADNATNLAAAQANLTQAQADLAAKQKRLTDLDTAIAAG